MEEIGTVSVGKSKFLQPMYVYNCVRKPGYVYDFTKQESLAVAGNPRDAAVIFDP